MIEILVAWWGIYSSGGSEGTDPHKAWVPDGTDSEITKYITDELLYGAGENEDSEHWRGVKFRRLTPLETENYIQAQLKKFITDFLFVVSSHDGDYLTPILHRLAEDGESYRENMVKTIRLFGNALK